MTETPVPPTASTQTPATAPPKPYWLYRLAAWVGIVAGIVFIVSRIFFAGAYFSGGGPGQHCHHGHHGHHGMFHKGHHHRGHGPHGPGPEGAGPGEVPPSAAPSLLPPPPAR